MAYQTISQHPADDSQHIDVLATDALFLLKQLIATPSPSAEENITAGLIENFIKTRGIKTHRLHNNIWAYNKYYNAGNPTILLNSHHDTVKPNEGYTRDPFRADIIGDKLYGLGSNDAGGCLVSLLAVFTYFYNTPNLAYNLCFAATAEEENSGQNGLKAILSEIGPIDFAIVGEPTQMHMATAEMGNMVLDCTAYGIAGHAARNEGDNALYKALIDIQWFSNYYFPKQSAFMGPVKMTVTQINAGLQYNIIPHECHFTVDVRLSDCYSPPEALAIIKANTTCTIIPREGILKASSIDQIHPLVRAGVALGRKTYVSPTSSDQGWLNVPSLKMGPGDSARSHMADEFIYVDEISEGINIYILLLKSMVYCLLHNPEGDKKFIKASLVLKIKKQHTNPSILSIDRHKLVFDADNKKEFLNWLRGRENRLQTMLLWCSIAVLVSYTAVMVTVVKLYVSLNIGHPVYMVALIIIIFCLFCVFIGLQYTINTYKPSRTNLVVKELVHFKVYVAHRQITLLAGYLITYSVFVLAVCALCYDTLWRAQKILQVTAPVSILLYAAGLFLLFKLAVKRRTYLNYITSIDDSIVKGFSNQ